MLDEQLLSAPAAAELCVQVPPVWSSSSRWWSFLCAVAVQSSFWGIPAEGSKYVTANFSWFEPILQRESGREEGHGFSPWCCFT